jgi:hypothetical protein
MTSHRLLGAASIAFALLFPACFGDSGANGGVDERPVPTPTNNDASTDIPDSPPAQSVVVDVGSAPRASSGNGAGVFIGYRGSGQWDVSWTCDTNISNEGCVFDLSIRGQSLAIASEVPTTAVTSATTTKIVTHTLTATETDSISLTTTPGQPITVSARFNGVAQPSLVFYIANNTAVAAVADPLLLTPASP